MSPPGNYRRALSRALFIILIIAIPLLPPLTDEPPPPEFRVLRSLLDSISLFGYVAIGITAAVSLSVITSRRSAGRADQRRKRGQSTTVDITWQLPIDQVVRHEHGGNGLASKPLIIPPLSLIAVHTPGMECVVIDGTRVIRHSRRIFTGWGTAARAKRVLLSPPPCIISGVKALSHDQLETTLSAAVIYRVSDPRAALVQAPLQEFTNLAQGIIVEHIHSHDQADLLKDRGALRNGLEDRLRGAKSLAGFRVVEVSLTSVDGDRRLIEIGTQARVEEKRADLVQAQGLNRLQTEEYNLKIEQLRLQLTEWGKTQDHNRLIEQEILRLNATNVQAVIGAVTALAQQGTNPDPALVSLQRLLTDHYPQLFMRPLQLTTTDPIQKANGPS